MNNLDLNMIKTITDVVLTVVGTIATFVWRKFVIHKHEQDAIKNAQDKKQAEAQAEKQAELEANKARDNFNKNMDTALEMAKNKVIPLAIDKTLGNQEKRQLAVQKTNAGLNKLGIDIPEGVVGEVTERAYQWYKANGGDVHKEVIQPSNNGNANNDYAGPSNNPYVQIKPQGTQQTPPTKPEE
ncbi:hypothetical protein [Apilactobacillus timberlakei]|uniref:Phage holin n=1 Tax=Apilactobacillus timberlakei TaxID=2008380 RepID=A0ABY2YSQ9_9LACO|nr:hypothetical protein [Apilactobacillus timberlakei]TPR12791.1 hypothetical protein DY048_07210 [Apilactobacillus timberlakei]TPR13674.1 hypothetical protein DY052_08080 [Apilactobacillus timberlakei]